VNGLKLGMGEADVDEHRKISGRMKKPKRKTGAAASSSGAGASPALADRRPASGPNERDGPGGPLDTRLGKECPTERVCFRGWQCVE
jgi:hypothetical protein